MGLLRKLDSLIKTVPPVLNAIQFRPCSILQERKLVRLPFLIAECVHRNEEVIGAKLAGENQQATRCYGAARRNG